MATAFTLAALSAELTNDPGGLGYSALRAAGGVAALAGMLNLPRSGTAADSVSYTVYRNDVAAKEVVNAIASADFTALTAVQLAALQLLFLGGTVDVTVANVRANFIALFGSASTATKNALTALASRNGSRAEALWGTGTAVSVDQVVQALS